MLNWNVQEVAEFIHKFYESPYKLKDIMKCCFDDRFWEDQIEHFVDVLLRMIEEKGMTEPQCYRRANVDRRTFSKIVNDMDYVPSKKIVLAFAVAMRLTMKETNELLAAAGLAFSRNFKFDLIVAYFMRKKVYDIDVINEALWTFGQELLGSKVK